jgi:beta-galactosidase
MDRRDFLKTTGAVIAAATLADPALAQSAGAAGLPVSPGRMLLPINRNWRYNPSFVQGAHDKQFDDSSFEKIVLPHTNIRLPWHSFDDKSYQFVSIYRRRFKLPPFAHERRVFVDFEGVMTAATVWINGVRLGEYKGGYTPFSFELTPYLDLDGENVLAVDVDSTERPDIPPFGYQIDYLTFGGIYREVALRIVPSAFIEDIFAHPADILTPHPKLKVDCYLRHLEEWREALVLEVELRDGEKVLAKASGPIPPAAAAAESVAHSLVLENLSGIRLWDLSSPHLYHVWARLFRGSEVVDRDSRRIGFREAQFTDHGFALNGKVIKLRGLDRHQTFPFVGQAMPGRVQRRDADILRNKFKCNIVRTSHYPQSRHFLDACDELGLLVLEEIPGWQHIGDESWKLLAVDNVRRMIRRDSHHPSIILWGVRINESRDDHDFYTRTNALARQLDPTRQTGGIRNFQGSEFLEDVFTMNDFGFPLLPPNHPHYLNTEFCGHTFPTKTIDNKERLEEHTVRHARVHDQLASHPQYAGGIGWCAFDYNTHADFGSGDRVCYHGVADIFREPKPAAGFYKSQCDPAEEVVLEPAFDWAPGDESIGFKKAMVCSNCDHLKFYIGGKLVAEAAPDTAQFPHLRYAPFTVDLQHKVAVGPWGDLRIEGYLQGKPVIAKNFSGKGIDAKFAVIPDATELHADGADSTRLVFRVTDECDAVRRFAGGAIQLELEGPAEIMGDNPFALVGGTGAVWIRAMEQPGIVRLTAIHPALGKREVQFQLLPVPPEIA